MKRFSQAEFMKAQRLSSIDIALTLALGIFLVLFVIGLIAWPYMHR